MIEYIKEGTKVRLLGDIQGVIKSILISEGHVSYEIGYFLNRAYTKCSWLSENEFEVLNSDSKLTIGFRNAI
jgi:hypothetical protein